ncbi:hypothetical protein BDW59DRAFT_103293 [Aspergillus cavernicola]|uniref:Amidohydrolase-related domain-containing protein n=1 Tax=Aspergillus cavernicola TaxID=176166 RepID=A0ABR4I423_9EURO
MAVRPCFSTTLLTLRCRPFILGPTSIRPRLDLSKYSNPFLSAPYITNTNNKPVKARVPAKTWDSHMHVVEPRYPVVANAAYNPAAPHTIDDAVSFESSLGIENVVLVQPSIYGFDNSCLLDALRQIGPSRGRGVVVIDPANTNNKTLKEWHSLGVRGVRVNFKSAGKVPSRNELQRTLSEQAQLISPLGWMIQIHTAMDTIPMLEEIIPRLGIKVCIDHFGGPELHKAMWENGDSLDPYSLPGFSTLISLLKAGRTYVKISAPYRLSKDEEYRDLATMTREFLRQAPNRILYATDWPHTRFANINIEPFTELCLRLCGSQALAEKVFRLNAEDLMDSRLEI